MPSNSKSYLFTQSKEELVLQQAINACISAAMLNLEQANFAEVILNYQKIVKFLSDKREALSDLDIQMLTNASYMVSLLSSSGEQEVLPHQQRFSPNDKRVIEQARLLLNVIPVYRDPAQDVSDMFDIYSDIFATETSQTFSNSLKSSRQCYEDTTLIDENIQKLIPNDGDSFLIIPIRSSPPNSHTLSAVIRRTDEGVSVTLVNKGRTHVSGFQERGEAIDHAEYEEFVFKDNPPSPDLFVGSATVDEIYNKFLSAVSPENHYCLNLISREQITGNCHFKECETGVKFAAFSRDKATALFRHQQGATPLQPPTKVKWPKTTATIHNMYIERLAEKNPTAGKQLHEIARIHQKNKIFRDIMAKRSSSSMTLQDLQDIMEASFGTRDIRQAISEIELYSLSLYGKSILKVIPENKELAELIGFYRNICNHNSSIDAGLYANMCRRLEPNFPTAVAQLKVEKSLRLLEFSQNTSLSFKDRKLLLQTAIQLNPTYEYAIKEYSSICRAQEAQRTASEKIIQKITSKKPQKAMTDIREEADKRFDKGFDKGF